MGHGSRKLRNRKLLPNIYQSPTNKISFCKWPKKIVFQKFVIFHEYSWIVTYFATIVGNLDQNAVFNKRPGLLGPPRLAEHICLSNSLKTENAVQWTTP